MKRLKTIVGNNHGELEGAKQTDTRKIKTKVCAKGMSPNDAFMVLKCR